MKHESRLTSWISDTFNEALVLVTKRLVSVLISKQDKIDPAGDYRLLFIMCLYPSLSSRLPQPRTVQ